MNMTCIASHKVSYLKPLDNVNVYRLLFVYNLIILVRSHLRIDL